jgi:hypothetical protein
VFLLLNLLISVKYGEEIFAGANKAGKLQYTKFLPEKQAEHIVNTGISVINPFFPKG